MKRQVLLIIILMCAVTAVTFAQAPQPAPAPAPGSGRMSSTYIKDPGFGGPVNFGVTFAPTISWMYPHTEGYERDGVIMGMRYGVNLNIN